MTYFRLVIMVMNFGVGVYLMVISDPLGKRLARSWNAFASQRDERMFVIGIRLGAAIICGAVLLSALGIGNQR